MKVTLGEYLLAPHACLLPPALMPEMDIEILVQIVSSFANGKSLTPAEKAELLRIAQGFASKDSARSADLSNETIRTRRKRLYRKLGVSGANEITSSLLMLALHALAGCPPAISPDAPANPAEPDTP